MRPVSVPTLILHGKHDRVVPYSQSLSFAECRPEVKLKLIDDEHQLLGDPEVFLRVLSEFVLSRAKEVREL